MVPVINKDLHMAHDFLARGQAILAVDGKLAELLTPHGLVADHLEINGIADKLVIKNANCSLIKHVSMQVITTDKISQQQVQTAISNQVQKKKCK